MQKTILSITMLFALAACRGTESNVNQATNINVNQKSQTANVRESSNQTAKVKNFLNSPETVNFAGTDFNLAWSSHPSENYYKQEFTPEDDDVEKYKQMILVELALGTTAKDALSQKIRELEARKPTDQIVKYQVLENKNTNEILLDFMISDGTGEEDKIVEWNAYRYGNYSDQKGKKGVYLFALSKRGYGKDSFSFVSELIANRQKYVAAFVGMKKPEITLK